MENALNNDFSSDIPVFVSGPRKQYLGCINIPSVRRTVQPVLCYYFKHGARAWPKYPIQPQAKLRGVHTRFAVYGTW
jgi:hypothetical protein